MNKLLVIIVAILFFTCSFIATGASEEKPPFVFATIEEGRNILTTKDEFIEQLSPFDRSCRMRTDGVVTEKEFLEFVSNNVRSWEKEEEDRVRPIIAVMEPRLERFTSLLPQKVYLVKTTGNEEGGAPYTRGNAIVIPARQLTRDTATLYKILSHELFHIISRHNKQLRDQLYETIGFKKCPHFKFPGTLEHRKITNPDSPMNDHCILVKAGKQNLWVTPILYSNMEKYSKAHSEYFFDYLQVAFLAVARDNGKGRRPTLFKGGKPRLYSEDELSGFYEQIGKNTDYTIHPEEILADNFSYLLFGIKEVESPEIIEKMEKVFKKAGNR